MKIVPASSEMEKPTAKRTMSGKLFLSKGYRKHQFSDFSFKKNLLSSDYLEQSVTNVTGPLVKMIL